jgi:hypothetical protein
LPSGLAVAAGCESFEATGVTGAGAETLDTSMGRILFWIDRDRFQAKAR